MFRLLDEVGKTRTVQQWPYTIQEEVGILAEGQQPDAAWVVDVLVEHAGDPGARQRIAEGVGVRAAAERDELHEQAAVGPLRLTVLHAAFLAKIRRLGTSPRLGSHAAIILGEMTYRIRQATLDDIEVLVHHRFAMFSDMGVPLDAAALAPAFAQWLRKLMPSGTYRAWLVESTSAPAEPPRLEPLPRASTETSPRIGGDSDTRATSATVVAGGGATIVPWPPGPRYLGESLAFVYNVYTEPAHRRRGLARRVMSAIHDWCRENGITSLALNASEDGLPLYTSLGYVVAPRPMMFCALGAERGAAAPEA